MMSADAWQMIRTAYKCSAELQVLLRALKENCPPEEYRGHARAIAAAIDSLGVQLIDRAVQAYPDLQKRIESDIATYGRLTE
jgi:hypothetical protein